MAEENTIPNVVALRAAYSTNAKKFNKQCKEALELDMISYNNFKIHHVNKQLHFVQFFYSMDGLKNTDQLMNSNILETRLVCEPNPKKFNKMCEAAFEEGFTPAGPEVQVTPPRLFRKSLYLTLNFIKYGDPQSEIKIYKPSDEMIKKYTPGDEPGMKPGF